MLMLQKKQSLIGEMLEISKIEMYGAMGFGQRKPAMLVLFEERP